MTSIKALLIFLTILISNGVLAEIVVVVNKSNDIGQLSQREIIDIYMGRKQSFPNGKPALPLDQAAQSMIREDFYQSLVKKSPAQINAYWARLLFTGRASPPRIISDASVVLDAIEQNPSAIGYIDSSMLNDRVKVVAHVE